MSDSHFYTLLLRDAAAQTIASPGLPHCWHRLKNCYLQVDDKVVKETLIRILLTHTPAEGNAGFLRATWLASVTRDDAYFAEAGRIAQGITPLDPDRLVALLLLAWSRILKNASHGAGFARGIHEAGFPQIVQMLAQHLMRQTAVRPPLRQIEAVRKVALIAPYLSAPPHAPTAIALQQARILIQQGVQVELYSCLDLVAPGMQHFLGGGEANAMTPFDVSAWGAQCPAGLTIRIGAERLSVTGRWVQMLPHIAAFDPDLVMSVGFYSPIVAPLFETRPVLGLNVHSVAPLDPVDVWLCALPEDAGKPHAQWGASGPSGVGWLHPYRVQRQPPASALSREALGLPEGAVVLISVGYRLDVEIEGAWAARMIALIKDHPNLTWLLVGGEGTMPPALSQAPVDQVRALRARGDIPAVLQCCDIYVNPPRMGGGFSVAEAMAEGLPVVAFAGSDGGRKIGGAAAGDDAGYFAKLAGLVASADLRQREGAAMRELFGATLDLDRSGPSLLAACNLALQRFRQRTTPAIS